jgi:phage terminase large subunit-like protein
MGTPDAVESIFVKHASGGTSVLQFKAYEQGRAAFQGTSQDFIHLDEECPEDIYVECLLRITTTNGIIYLTATPLLGLTDLMLAFLPELRPATEIQP